MPLLTRTVQSQRQGRRNRSREKRRSWVTWRSATARCVGAAVDTLWQWQLQSEFDDPPLTMLLANIVRYLAPPPGRKPGHAAGVAGRRHAAGRPGAAPDDRSERPELRSDSQCRAGGHRHPARRHDRTASIPATCRRSRATTSSRILIEQPGPYKVAAKHGKFESQREFLAGAAAGEFVDLSVDRPGMQRLTKAAGGELIDGALGAWIEQAGRPGRPQNWSSATWKSGTARWCCWPFLLLVSVDCWIRKRQGMA